jgi:predicted MFS family arabinose efflux permease
MQSVGTPLPERLRARGRRLAWTSHPAGMTHRYVYTEELPTLALVALGASETVVGLQRAFERLGQLLQLPTLRTVGRFRKRSILVVGQGIAVAAGIPLVGFAWLAAEMREWAVAITLGSLALSAAGIVISQTVWFPLLRGYVEPGRIGHFFGILRSGWHLTLIAFFVAAQRWLAAHPGSFGLLFGVATACGLLRMAIVARLPEAEGERGTPVRVREAVGLLRSEPLLLRYLLGVGLSGAARRALVPFVIVWMRRGMGLSEADVLLTTVAGFAGGFASLYLWGRVVDRSGPNPTFRITGLGMALLFLLLIGMPESGAVAPMIGFFFLLAVLASGFGVADTQALFSLTPAEAPTRHLVVADVGTSLVYGLAPLTAGLLLELAIAWGLEPLAAYRALFGACALAALLALAPLRGLPR